eukprot:4982215-Prymnesium_polylepis.2
MNLGQYSQSSLTKVEMGTLTYAVTHGGQSTVSNTAKCNQTQRSDTWRAQHNVATQPNAAR